ncbi:Hypothetical predicted protein [Podarcis lilfordi]|uniref:Uncharacterized protein n=1 Tax=Podarcis lilfordi TaxID=74358 RepID=A0AA35P8C7_9SAUR|nr:Hypothetical predicted protein [Podarcis lilfordi]
MLVVTGHHVTVLQLFEKFPMPVFLHLKRMHDIGRWSVLASATGEVHPIVPKTMCGLEQYRLRAEPHLALYVNHLKTCDSFPMPKWDADMAECRHALRPIWLASYMSVITLT